MKSSFLFLIITISCFTPSALAQSSDVDGNQLLEHCRSYLGIANNDLLPLAQEQLTKMKVNAGFCMGYMSAIADSNARNEHFCAPANATIEQLVRVVTKWMKEHPESLHLNAGVISYTALRAAFPCH